MLGSCYNYNKEVKVDNKEIKELVNFYISKRVVQTFNQKFREKIGEEKLFSMTLFVVTYINQSSQTNMDFLIASFYKKFQDDIEKYDIPVRDFINWLIFNINGMKIVFAIS